MKDMMNWKTVLFVAVIAVVANVMYSRYQAKQSTHTTTDNGGGEETGE